MTTCAISGLRLVTPAARPCWIQIFNFMPRLYFYCKVIMGSEQLPPAQLLLIHPFCCFQTRKQTPSPGGVNLGQFGWYDLKPKATEISRQTLSFDRCGVGSRLFDQGEFLVDLGETAGTRPISHCYPWSVFKPISRADPTPDET